MAAHNKGHGFASHLCNCCIQTSIMPILSQLAPWSSVIATPGLIKVQMNNVIIRTMVHIQQNRGRNQLRGSSCPVSQLRLIITSRCGAARWRRLHVAASSRPRLSCWSWRRVGWGSSRRPGYRPAQPETQNNQPQMRHGGWSITQRGLRAISIIISAVQISHSERRGAAQCEFILILCNLSPVIVLFIKCC